MTSEIPNLSPAQLRKAADLIEKRKKIDAELQQLLGNGAPTKTAKSTGRKKGNKMSAAARKKIAAAQKRRWAKHRKEAANK